MPALKNLAARRIDLRGKGEKKYRLMPAGPAVEVPDEIAKRAFVRNLIESGDIEVVGAGGEGKKAKKQSGDPGNGAQGGAGGEGRDA